ncbi:cytochrome P450 [Arthroderma uncinatum]|uniref:cytochrome P450 n=1 Tax=Arthroderma uncinatum TaxID=74035 RepID=UPI00144ACF6A|nr:cytochrome P450 [Arthroderma uncinatum]KAF3483805.1 cytochrome P450 [Arthroderma uncinatum]
MVAEKSDGYAVISIAIITALVAIVLGWLWTRDPDEIPTINSYPGDFSLKRAHKEYLLNSRNLIKDGVKRFDGPFRVITALGSRVILPASYTEWVKGCLDLDHQALVHHEYFGGYPGMEGIGMVTDPRKITIDVAKKKLNQSSQCKVMQEHIKESLKEAWDDSKDWHVVDWPQNAVSFIARMSSAWLRDAAAGRSLDHTAAQLAFAVSALHTTTELLKQTLLDICTHPKLIQPIRDEVSEALKEDGWTTAGLFKMQLLDSVIKESQRLKPGLLVNLERKALCDVTLANGMKLPKGTNLAVDSSMMWDPTIYPNPTVYDGYRFLRLRQSGNGTAALVSTSREHIAFGIGKPICPGRFFAANELKVALANILMNYDVKIAGDREPKIIEIGFEMLSNPEASLMVKRR